MLKMQSSNVVSIIGKGVESLDNFDSASAFFTALGKEHQGRGIRVNHFKFFEHGFIAALEEVIGPHFEPVVGMAWSTMFWIMQEKMLKFDQYDHNVDFIFLRELN